MPNDGGELARALRRDSRPAASDDEEDDSTRHSTCEENVNGRSAHAPSRPSSGGASSHDVNSPSQVSARAVRGGLAPRHADRIRLLAHDPTSPKEKHANGSMDDMRPGLARPVRHERGAVHRASRPAELL